MKAIHSFKITILAIIIALFMLSGCSSTTLIKSVPSGAKVYLNGKYKGETPYAHTDEDIIFSRTNVKITKEGYEDYYTFFSRDEEIDPGPAICGFFFIPSWLWAFKYDEERTYQLIPYDNSVIDSIYDYNQSSPTQIITKSDELRELKKLLDEGILTQEEFEAEKKKILEND